MIWRRSIGNIRNLSTLPLARKSRVNKWVIPSVLVVTSSLGIAYTIKWVKSYEKPKELQADYFIPYQITRKVINDANHFIIELTPTASQNVNVWSKLTSRNLWSVEVKQPEIMVVRNYTPLPLQFVNNGSDDLEVIDKETTANINNNNGKLVLFIKNYDQGEVSKWIAKLPLNHTIEIRGPFVEYIIPKQVENVNFFAAGTAIVSPLQLLLNPYLNGIAKPKLNVFYSCGNMEKELGPINNIVSKYLHPDSTSLHLVTFEDSKNENIAKNMKKFTSIIPIASKYPESKNISLVCGPDRYVETIAGKRYDLSQGPVKGLLSEKGWSSKNVYKLS